MSTLKEKAQEILDEKLENIIPENIKDGVNIFDVSGVYSGDVNIDLTSGIKFGYSLFSTLPNSVANANWESVSNTSDMFKECNNLTSIPLLDTSNVTAMGSMFASCYCLTTIPQLDTSNVVSMSNMFTDCSSLTTIPQLNTSNVMHTSDMFSGCSSLTSIPLLDTSNVISMSNMFAGCTSLVTIPQLDTSNVINMNNMFTNCQNLTTIPLLNTSKVAYMNGIFGGCNNLTTVPQLDISSVTTVSDMFINCVGLTTIPKLNYINVCNANNLFAGCTSLTEVDITTLDFDKLSGNYSNMFWGVPDNCHITVKRLQDKEVLLQMFPNLTNIDYLPGHTITLNTIEDVSCPSVGYSGDIYTIKSNEDFKAVGSFKLNGVTVQGNQFTMPDENIIISDIVIEESYIIESEHNPYRNDMDKTYFDGYVSGARKLQLVLEYGTESGCDTVFIDVGNGEVGYSDGVSGQTTPEYTETILSDNNYLKVRFYSDGSVNNYYGFKLTVIRLDENGNPIDN